eukprot:tig00020614_g12160.t1
MLGAFRALSLRPAGALSSRAMATAAKEYPKSIPSSSKPGAAPIILPPKSSSTALAHFKTNGRLRREAEKAAWAEGRPYEVWPHVKLKRPWKTAKALMIELNNEYCDKLRKELPVFKCKFRVGDVLTVKYKERPQALRYDNIKGVCIAIKKAGMSSYFTVLSMTDGVEMSFPFYGGHVLEVTATRAGGPYEEKRVRRAKLYYLWEYAQDLDEEPDGDN